MFTGIIEEVGEVRAVEARQTGARITVGCRMVLADAYAREGDEFWNWGA